MRIRLTSKTWTAGVAALIALVAVMATAVSDDRAEAAGLSALRSCDNLRDYLRAHPRALRAYPPGAILEDALPTTGDEAAAPGEGGGGANPAPPSDSPTNVQEAGVDEPDIVKATDTTVFTVDGTTLRAVDVSGPTPVLAGALELPNGAGEGSYGGTYELLLSGDRLLAIGTAYSGVVFEAGPGHDRTILAEIDVSDPAAMSVLRKAVVEGAYVSGRLTGTTARVVVNDLPAPYIAESGKGRALVPRLKIADRTTGEKSRGKLVDCADVRRPSRFAGAEMLSVMTIDLAQGLPALDVDSVMTSGQIVYASTENLYVASERWVGPDSDPKRISDVSTEIHRFDITDPAATSYVASGQVEGFMLSQWALSEQDGILRVASTTSPPWEPEGGGAESESFVTVLGADLEAGRLREVGRVGGLGEGEQIYAVRFVGDTGYVVTFRQVDPLYTLDLSDPAAPRVVGELKIPGYSAYLHPVGPGLLLGIGQDATGAGQTLGVHASLFDVSDPANPVRLDEQSLGGAYSYTEVESDHHAFSFFPQHQLATVPVESYGPDGEFYGAFGLRVAPGTADPLGVVAKVEHGTGYGAQIRRTLALGASVYTVSPKGIGAHDPATLGQTAFAGF